MPTSEKKLAAALAAVERYLEEEAAANAPVYIAPPPSEPNQWALQGRADLMAGRQLVQLRAFSTIR